MALAKDIASIQTYSCHENFLGSENYRFDHDHHQKTVHDHTGDNSRKANSLVETKEYMFNASGDNNMYTFGHSNAGSSNNVLSFVQNESPPDQESYSRSSDHDHDQDVYSSLWDHNFSTGNNNVRLLDNFSSYQSASNNNTPRENQEIFGLFFDEAIDTNDNVHVHVQQQVASSSNKRQGDMGESNMQAIKKQCTSGVNTKKPKPKTVSSKDPQSIAAKNRRERISERLKVLQELVPNGSKVDLVTMLEKAISYVKFLQLQVKVLATDDFWPVQGGKAPEISQVKEAIDAILSSQRDRN